MEIGEEEEVVSSSSNTSNTTDNQPANSHSNNQSSSIPRTVRKPNRADRTASTEYQKLKNEPKVLKLNNQLIHQLSQTKQTPNKMS